MAQPTIRIPVVRERRECRNRGYGSDISRITGVAYTRSTFTPFAAVPVGKEKVPGGLRL